ncbi:unnamed protein product [Alopecurus aequalis]
MVTMAIEEYIEFMAGGGRGPGGDELRRKAKEHLLSSGWSFHTKAKSGGRQELRYMAPHGASYISLIVACKKYQMFKNHPPCPKSSSKNTAPKSRTGTARVLLCPGSGGAGNGGSDSDEDAYEGPPRAPGSRKRRRVSALYADDALKKFAAKKKKTKASKSPAESRVLQPRLKDGDKSKTRAVAAASALVPSACQPGRARTILAVLMEKNIIRPTAKLSYRRTTRGPAVKQGTVAGDGYIRCLCGCGATAFTVAEFAAHADRAATIERASASVFLGDRRSLSQCLVQLMRADGKTQGGSPSPGARVKRKYGAEFEDGDLVCSVCADAGEMLLCDCCPSTFHHACVGLDATPQGEWFCPPCRCVICNSGKFEPATEEEFTDKTVVYCDQCEREYHVGCIRSRGNQLECRPKGPLLCGQDCSNIFQRLQGLVGRSIPTSAEGLTFRVLRSSKLPEEEAMAAEEHGKLSMAFDVLHECFVTLIEPITQSDLSHDIVFNRESWLRRLNFRGFYVVGLERGGELITVGTLRVYGNKVAELPLVGTRFAHRRQGMCHLLMDQLEMLLAELGVERLVLPAVPELLQTWTGSFGFRVMTKADRMEIAEHSILCFQGTTMCHKFINKAGAAPER